MPRKRNPFLVAGKPIQLEAPGFQIRDRGNRREAYWIATRAARDRGYVPRTVRLHGDLDDLADVRRMQERCAVLCREMKQWLADGGNDPRPIFDGTLRSLIACYQTDRESPYRNISQNTQRIYDEWCGTLERAFGARRLDRLSGQDLRRWFNEIAKPSKPGGLPRLSLARKCVRSMLSILLAYGAELGLPACLGLLQVLERMTLSPPRHLLHEWKRGKPKQVPMTFAYAEAIVDEGLKRGTRRHRSLALGVAAQFEFTVAQIDVIGSWERAGAARALPEGAIAQGAQVWQPGLRYEDFLPDLVLDLSRSKTSKRGIFDMSEYPLFMRALAAVPEAERHGPLAVDESGQPFRRRYYNAVYRELADARNIPHGVWNMNARHGGATEARQSGAALEDTSEHLQHSNIQTTKRHYIEPNVETTRRVARARVKHRAAKKDAG
jgi:hypothetical protein